MFVIVVGKRSFQSQKGNQCHILKLLSPSNRSDLVGFDINEKYVGKNLFDKVDLNFGYDVDIDLNGFITSISSPVADLAINLYE